MTASGDLAHLRSILAIVHTHWDREWYHPAIRFRARLVALVDAVLENSGPFLLDGQAIVLSDYLSVRPTRAEALREALATGRLEAGPWYVLADNLIPSGEAIVRNLAAGKRVMRRFDAVAPRVAYCPDTFGHPAAMPSIARGFGLETAVVWRGFGGASHPATDTFTWRSADGTSLPTFHLPPDGYEFGSGLPRDGESVRARWTRMVSTLGRRNRTGLALLTVGADHHAPPPDIDARLAALQQAAATQSSAVMLARAGLSQFSNALKLVARPERALPEVHGELRDSYGYTWTLQGTLATRAHQKRANARLERRLLHEVEPLAALAWMRAEPAPADGRIGLEQLPSLVDHAWETLLRTHPHDTLCGCSIDAVADAMTMRQRDVASLSRELRDAAMALALGHDVVAVRDRAVRTDPLCVAYNPLAYARGGVAQLTLLETEAHVSVGPPHSDAPLVVPFAPSPPSLDGVLLQHLSSTTRQLRRESPQHYPDNDQVRVHRVLAWLPEVPALGLRAFESRGTRDAATTPTPARAHWVDDRSVEVHNGRLALRVSSRGVTIRMSDTRIGAREIVDALRLETIHDAGDTYTPSLRGDPERLRIVSVAVDADGPLRASVRLRWAWRGTQRVRRERIDVETVLSLDAESEVVRCQVRGRNGRRDHRLQLVWRTDVSAATPVRVMADAAMGWVDRTSAPNSPAPHARPFEVPPSTMPMQRWLCVSNADHAATMMADGLAESSCVDAQLALTLVRAVGVLSRHDLPERPGHAGWPAPTPGAQSLGAFSALTGLLLHGAWSDATAVHIERATDSLLLPLAGASIRDLEGGPREIAGPSLHGHGLVFSTVRLGDDGASLVLRCRNVTSAEVAGHWQLPDAFGDVSLCESRAARLDDEPLSEWEPVTDSRIPVHVAPYGHATIHVRRAT